MISNDKELTRLIKRAMRGDQNAFESLYLRYLKEIIFQARKLLDRKEDAEDAAQEIVLALYRNIKTLSSPFAFHAYHYRTIYTTCINKNMQQGGKDLQLEDFEETLADSEEAQPEQRFEESEIRREIRQLVDRLAPKQRLCVYLYYFYDMSYEEIAQALDASTNAVGVNLTKARKAMERLLTKDEQDKREEQSASAAAKSGGALALAPLVCDALREGINIEVSEQSVANVAAACQTLVAAGATAVGAGTATTATMVSLKGVVSALVTVSTLLGGASVMMYGVQLEADAQQTAADEAQQLVVRPGFEPQAQIILVSGTASADAAGSTGGVEATDSTGGADTTASADAADGAGTTSTTSITSTTSTTTAYLSTNEGWGEVWYLYNAAGELLATGTSDRIEGPLNDLAPGRYTIEWVLINSDSNRAIATQPFTVT
ncbi:MAG: sigma-70 family RNA polymerase sigma factor [Coriobacteriales bacterium]|jgi:RNA polymerase sigma-70 factor (ECF subfamily)|nr:sigma-70 family RNA polymerase sigma factor [Coriobacteriales bacterium]